MPDKPLSPSTTLETASTIDVHKTGVYYGWLMVLVAALAMLATLPGRTHGLGMITERLLADSSLQLDRQTFGYVNLWATLIGALFCLPCGWLVDKAGLRSSVTFVVGALALVVLAMTQAHG